MLGVANPHPRTGSLVVRKTVLGGTVVEGLAPDYHEFSERFVERELGHAIRLLIYVGEETYEVYAIENGDLKARRLQPRKAEKVREPKRRWWRRNRG